MAAKTLKRTTFIWIPPRSVGERALVNEAVLLALVRDAEGEKRWARVSLEALPAMKSATLLFDARDVMLAPVQVPPLSGTRLAQALPNLVEDVVLQDVASCAIALGPKLEDGRRLLAIIDRGWLDFVVGAVERRGVRVQAAWPAQLALELREEAWSIACVNHGIALRSAEHRGIGWSASNDSVARTEALVAAFEAAAHDDPRPRRLIAFAEDPSWRASLESAAARLGVAVEFSGLRTPPVAPLDLLAVRSRASARSWFAAVDWRAWRVPAAVAAACLAAWLLGLNLHWRALAGERDDMRARLEAGFREAFPQAQVVADPLLQMQRLVSDLRLRTGERAPDDFLPLLARFTQAMGPRASDALTSLEYREGRLRVRFRAGFTDTSGARDALRASLLARGMKVQFEGENMAVAVVGLQS